MRTFLAEAWYFSISVFCCASPRRVWCLSFPGWFWILSDQILWWLYAPGLMSLWQNWGRHCKCGLMMLNKGEESLLQFAGYAFASAASISLVFSASGAHWWLLFTFLSTGSSDSFGSSWFIPFATPVCNVSWSYVVTRAGLCTCLCWNTYPLISLISIYPNEWQPVFQCADSSL